MRLSANPDHRMMWGRGGRERQLKWLLGNWSELHVEMIFKEVIQKQCQAGTVDWADVYSSLTSTLQHKIKHFRFLLNVCCE